MKKVFPLLIIAIFMINVTYAQQDLSLTGPEEVPKLEIGVTIGEPSGLSGKWWLDRRSAVQGVVGYSFTHNGRLHLNADYLYHSGFFSITRGILPVYFGLGAVVRANESFTLGARIPVGAEYILNLGSLALFAEIAPQVDFITDVEFAINGGAGIRLTFGSVD
jgi:hypothetical protein